MASEKMVGDKNKDELQEANYRLNRLMKKLGVSDAFDDEGRYENACLEVGRLQGIEIGLQYIQNITQD